MKNHRLFLSTILTLFTLSVCAQAERIQKRDYNKYANYDESKVPAYTLPDALLCSDGTRVTTVEEWEQKRRPELFQLFETYMFGKAPAAPSPLIYRVTDIAQKELGGKAIRKLVDIMLTSKSEGPVLHLQLYLPREARRHRVPVILGISFKPNNTILEGPWALDSILAHGYGLATFCYEDVEPDRFDNHQTCLHTYYYKGSQREPWPDEWGAVAAWAWGMSRAMDYLVQDPQVDASKVAILGHSRLGKAVLWAAACDPRFALIIPVNSGCCGAALSRRQFGETVETVNYRFRHWYCGNYKQFNAREEHMPFDQHELIALSAPRPIYIASAEDDKWSDPYGEFLGAKGAEPVYALYGLKGIGSDQLTPLDVPYADGAVAYHIRRGPHAVLSYDWQQFLRFADRYFK